MKTIRNRIGAIVFAQIVALLFVAGAFVADCLRNYEAASTLRAETQLAVAAGELVHRLQIERGLSTWFLRAPPDKAPLLSDARSATDAAAARFHAAIVATPATARAGLLAVGESATANSLSSLRSTISARAIQSQKAFEAYTAIVETTLGVVDHSASQQISPDLGRLMSIYTALARGKEFAGRERAMGAAALSARRIETSDLTTIASLEGAQAAAFYDLSRNAPASFASRWQEFAVSEVVRNFESMRKSLFASRGSAPAISSPDWFSAATARIDALHVIEESVAAAITSSANSEAAAALSNLTNAVLLCLLVTVGALCAAFFVARSITVPLRSVTETIRKLTAGALDAPIPNVKAPSEVAEMTEALRLFRDSLLGNQALTKELADSSRMASLGALVAGIAHEVNTPIGNALVVSSSFSENVRGLQAEIAAGAIRRSSIDRFVKSAEDADHLLSSNLQRASEQIRSFKRLAADQSNNGRRSFNLRNTVEDAARTCLPFTRQAGVAVSVDIQPDVEMDSFPGALSQVVVNLLENAVKHGLKDRTDGKVTLTGQKVSEDQVRLIVEDNGAGIPPQLCDKIFAKFFTTSAKSGGTGLGLHIVQSIVTAQLGGTIALQQREQTGARFVLTLPVRIRSVETQSPEVRIAA